MRVIITSFKHIARQLILQDTCANNYVCDSLQGIKIVGKNALKAVFLFIIYLFNLHKYRLLI